MIRHTQVSMTADASGDGSAATGLILGVVLSVHLNFGDSIGAGTNTTVATTGTGGMPANTLLTIAGSETDALYHPRHQVHGATGTGLTYNGTHKVQEAVPVADTITVTVAGGVEGGTLIATVIYEDFR